MVEGENVTDEAPEQTEEERLGEEYRQRTQAAYNRIAQVAGPQPQMVAQLEAGGAIRLLLERGIIKDLDLKRCIAEVAEANANRIVGDAMRAQIVQGVAARIDKKGLVH